KRDWSSDVCSSDLTSGARLLYPGDGKRATRFIPEEICPRAAAVQFAADTAGTSRGGSAICRPWTRTRTDFRSIPHQPARSRRGRLPVYYHRRIPGAHELVRALWFRTHRGCCREWTTEDVPGPADSPCGSPPLTGG